MSYANKPRPPHQQSGLVYLFLDLETTGLFESRHSRSETERFARGKKPLGALGTAANVITSWICGADTDGDEIVEVGVIGTTLDLKPLFEVETMIAPTRRTLRRAGANPVVYGMMMANGLWGDLEAAIGTGLFPSLNSVETDLVALINRYSAPGAKVVLAGSGVGTFDSRFIKVQMPALAARLTYYPHDIGVLRREWKIATGHDLVDSDNNKTHRAFDDVLCHLEEARAYREVFGLLAEIIGGSDLEMITCRAAQVRADVASV